LYGPSTHYLLPTNTFSKADAWLGCIYEREVVLELNIPIGAVTRLITPTSI